MNLFQVIFSSFIIVSIARILSHTRKNVLTPVEIIFWIVVWLLGAMAIVVPTTSQVISRFLGIGRGADLIIYTSIIVLYYVVYRLYIKLDLLNKAIKELSTKYALKGVLETSKRPPRNK